jgi:hypothetical protein
MHGLAGLRKVKVFEEVTEGELDRQGSFGYVEVTNKGVSECYFIPNDFPEHGHTGVGIPVKSGETRHIPMTVYKFTATAAVTVVAYGA